MGPFAEEGAAEEEGEEEGAIGMLDFLASTLGEGWRVAARLGMCTGCACTALPASCYPHQDLPAGERWVILTLAALMPACTPALALAVPEPVPEASAVAAAGAAPAALQRPPTTPPKPAAWSGSVAAVAEALGQLPGWRAVGEVVAIIEPSRRRNSVVGALPSRRAAPPRCAQPASCTLAQAVRP